VLLLGKIAKSATFQVWTQSNNVDCDFLMIQKIRMKYGNIIGDAVWIGTNVVISPELKSV
jgi:hypothetical protein